MARKITRKGLVKKLDKVVSEYVRARDKRCVTCNSTERLGCGHIFSRIAYSTRWDLENCHAQCWACNYKHEYDPYPYMQWAEQKLGKDGLEALHIRYNTPRKFKDHDLEDLIKELTA